MKDITRDIMERQVEAMLAPWRATPLPQKPPRGWIRAIRECLGMPTSFLARKLDVEQSTVTRYESSEATDAITLKTLSRIAEALDCELVYALVPKKQISQIIKDRATEIARKEINPIAHSMSLESQSTTLEERENLINNLTEQLLHGSRRDLWR